MRRRFLSRAVRSKSYISSASHWRYHIVIFCFSRRQDEPFEPFLVLTPAPLSVRAAPHRHPPVRAPSWARARVEWPPQCSRHHPSISAGLSRTDQPDSAHRPATRLGSKGQRAICAGRMSYLPVREPQIGRAHSMGAFAVRNLRQMLRRKISRTVDAAFIHHTGRRANTSRLNCVFICCCGRRSETSSRTVQ